MPVVAKAAAASPADLVDQERLVAAIKSLPTKRAARGDREHEEGLIKTQEILIEKLKELGYEPQTEEVDAVGLRHDKEKPYLNIWVDLKGKGFGDLHPGKPSEPVSSPPARDLLIVGAHFDAVPNAPGADDNGTGVAALLEMARLLKDTPMRHNVRLCFFNLEECGLVGSTFHARRVKEEYANARSKVIGMISMDMLGYYSDEPGSQKSPIPEMEGFKAPDVADFIAMATVLKHRKFSQALTKGMKETAPGLKVVTVDFLPIAIPDLLRSDHAPFLAIGIPAVIVSDTANFRSKHYHKPTDTIETLDLPKFTLTVRGLVGAVHRMAVPVEATSDAKE